MVTGRQYCYCSPGSKDTPRLPVSRPLSANELMLLNSFLPDKIEYRLYLVEDLAEAPPHLDTIADVSLTVMKIPSFEALYCSLIAASTSIGRQHDLDGPLLPGFSRTTG